MQILISPAKTLDFETPSPTTKYTQPHYLNHSAQLIDICRKLTAENLIELMKISPKLAELNVERFKRWQQPFNLENAKQAIFALKGEVYQHLDANTLCESDIDFAHTHMYILSGLYGLLRPLDLIQPYRLEMGVKLPNPKGKNLYAFWKDTLTNDLNLAVPKDDFILNLASQEYFKAIDTKKLQAKIITPIFKDEKNGRYKVISFFAKRARGRFARWAIQNQLKHIEQLTAFNSAGYTFTPSQSTDTSLVFQREEQKK